MDDVISQGPERDARPPLSRRWRFAAGTLAVVAAAGLAVIGFSLRHDSGAPGAPASSATAGVGRASVRAVPVVPVVPAPGPQGPAAIVICSPSTGACSMQGSRGQVLVRFDGLRTG